MQPTQSSCCAFPTLSRSLIRKMRRSLTTPKVSNAKVIRCCSQGDASPSDSTCCAPVSVQHYCGNSLTSARPILSRCAVGSSFRRYACGGAHCRRGFRRFRPKTHAAYFAIDQRCRWCGVRSRPELARSGCIANYFRIGSRRLHSVRVHNLR